MPFTAKIDGDAEKGWIGEIHDGKTFQVHHPVGDTLRLALSHMLFTHFGPAEPAKTTDEEQFVQGEAKPVEHPKSG